LEVERDMVNGALDASLTVMSNRLNRTMKALTIVTVCVALVGSVFGAWGMNFEQIPLSASPAGFWIVAGGTVALITTALLIGAWRRWW
jgi:magnesium transporter